MNCSGEWIREATKRSDYTVKPPNNANSEERKPSVTWKHFFIICTFLWWKIVVSSISLLLYVWQLFFSLKALVFFNTKANFLIKSEKNRVIRAIIDKRKRMPLVRFYYSEVILYNEWSPRNQFSTNVFYCKHQTDTTLHQWWPCITGICRRVFKNWAAGRIQPLLTMWPITLNWRLNNSEIVLRYCISLTLVCAYAWLILV